MLENRFKYVVKGTPIDSFYATSSKEKLMEEETLTNLDANYKFVMETVKMLSGENPYIIRYFSIPNYDWCDMDVCALAKIYNDGETFVFTNNKKFAEFICETSSYGFNLKSL